VFRRSDNVLGRDIRACHPPKSVDKVEAILSEMKNERRESAEFWIDMKVGDAPQPERSSSSTLRRAIPRANTWAAWSVRKGYAGSRDFREASHGLRPTPGTPAVRVPSNAIRSTPLDTLPLNSYL
jgi:hypothetical protein